MMQATVLQGLKKDWGGVGGSSCENLLSRQKTLKNVNMLVMICHSNTLFLGFLVGLLG